MFRFYIVITALFIASSAWAQDVMKDTSPLSNDKVNIVHKKFGIAMHGTPKYDENDTHIDYANPEAPKGGHITHAAIGTFDTLNPYSIRGKAAQGLNLVYDRLMARVWDEPFTMYPLIAQSYEMPEDRSEITFHLNPKARFHDGTRITADDVLFSFQTLKTEGRPNMRSVYRLVATAEKTGNNGVRFVFKDGYDEETALIIAMMPVLSKDWWAGRTFDATTLDIPNLNGPYTVESFDTGRSITYKRVEDYWAKDLLPNVGHYNFDRVTYDYYRDDTIAFEAFKAGETDIRRETDIAKWAGAYDFPALGSGEVIKEAIPHQRPEKAKGLIFNTRRAPFNDPKIREALSLLFDFDWANKNLFYGEYKRIKSFYPNSELAATGHPNDLELSILEPYREEIPAAVFGPAFEPANASSQQELRTNMRRASALLKESGWSVIDGKQMKDGQPLAFEILLSAPEDEKLALHFKRSLDKLGINVNIRVLDAAAYRGRMNNYDFDMTLYYWLSSLSPGTEQILYYGCQAANEPARWNFPGICNPAIDAIAAAVAQAKSRESLVAHIRALDRILMWERYMIPLYYSGSDYFSYKNNVKHPENTPIYGAVLETWWMDQEGE